MVGRGKGGWGKLTVAINRMVGVVPHTDHLADVVLFVLRHGRGEVLPVCHQPWRPADGKGLAGLVTVGGTWAC